MSTQRVVLPVLPTGNVVMLPGVVLALELGGPAGTKLAEEMAAGRAPRLLLVPGDLNRDTVTSAVGVEVEVVRLTRGKHGTGTVAMLSGVARRRVVAALQLEPYLTAETEAAPETASDGPELETLAGTLRDTTVKLLHLSGASAEAVREVAGLREPSRLADMIAAHGEFSTAEAVAVLGELDVSERVKKVLGVIERRVAASELAAQHTPDPKLREQALRQKMAEIQKALGEEPDADAAGEWNAKIAAAEMPPEALAVARREARRLSSMEASAPDHALTRTYLEWLVELPWSKRTEDKLDLAAARAILDEDHDGLAKIKQRVIEYLAVRKLNPAKKGPILLLVGPPGVGKTSLGRSIARALGRQYGRMSLGGVRDEAEIRGHRRTYIGALPGRIIQGLRRAGTRNPVFVLDEIDKLGAGTRGDPSSALLEVLDPAQNDTFSDHYVEVPFDLSEVVFIATANDLGAIAAPLRDRMEVLSLAGYTTAEKRKIASRHLVPKQLAEHGLAAEHIAFAPAALDGIIEGHTREAGVRNLEREVARVVRGVAVKVVAGHTDQVTVDVSDLPDYLGPAPFENDLAERDQRPGVATGLAWTPVGGDILFLETMLMPGSGKLVVTGQLGDVMKESAQAALSYVRSHADALGVKPGLFEGHDIHVHVPSGGVPKDGPSAGQAITTALVSLVTGRAVRGDVAMTGEITLRGHVLPVGGITSKVLAAHRAGIRRVILPAGNAKDVAEIPAEVREALDLRLVSRVEETLALALEPAVVEGVVVANGNQPPPPLPVAPPRQVAA